jgi:hypothetical protein
VGLQRQGQWRAIGRLKPRLCRFVLIQDLPLFIGQKARHWIFSDHTAQSLGVLRQIAFHQPLARFETEDQKAKGERSASRRSSRHWQRGADQHKATDKRRNQQTA